MSAFTSLLARDHVVSVRTIEDALQKQVISGGELETVLLEMDAAQENVLCAYRAAVYGLRAASREEAMAVADSVLRLVPKDAALRYRFVPLSVTARTLDVAVCTPLSAELIHELGFFLGYDLSLKLIAEVRLAAAMSLHYGVDMTPRLRRLAQKLNSQAPGPLLDVRPLGVELYEKPPATLLRSSAAEEPLQRKTPLPPPERATSVNVSPVVEVGAQRDPAVLEHHAQSLLSAQSRDEILKIFLNFVSTILPYCALFVVQRNQLEGLEALSNQTWTTIRHLTLPRGETSPVDAVLDSTQPAILDNNSLSELLDRQHVQSSLLLPICIQQRAVLLLYADRQDRPVLAQELIDVQAIGPATEAALTRMLMRKKSNTGGFMITPAEEVREVLVEDSQTQIRPRLATKRPGPLSALGLPRTAPPPPLVPSMGTPPKRTV